MLQTIKISTFLVVALLTFCVGVVSAQQKEKQESPPAMDIPDAASPETYRRGVIEGMTKGNWELGVAMAGRCIELYGERYKEFSLGDKFGWFYYQKGVCLIQLKKYDEAAEAFRTCYSKFPGEDNEFGRMAILGLGEAQVGQKKYDEALVTFDKFIRERRTARKYRESRANIGLLYSLKAQCNFLSPKPDFKQGIENLTLCVKNRYPGPASSGVSDKDIIDAAMVMLDASFAQNKEKEALEFLKKYPSILNIGEERLAPFLGHITKTVQTARDSMVESWEAKNEEKAGLALQIFSTLIALIPDKADIVVETKETLAILEKLGGSALPTGSYMGITYYKRLYANSLKSIEEMEEPVDIFSIQLAGSTHSNVGSVRVANASYRLLDEYYPTFGSKKDSGQKEQNLYNLVLTSWIIEDYENCMNYVQKFSATYPQSPLRSVIEGFLVQNMLDEGRYEECLDQSKKMQELTKADTNGKFYIMARYCEAMSLYKLRRFDEAESCLVAFEKQYRDVEEAKSQYAVLLYALGDTYISMQAWPKARKILTDYIEKYSDKTNPHLPSVYYLRAYAYFAQIRDEEDKGKIEKSMELAMQNCDFIIENFKDSDVLPMAMLLKANILYADDKTQEEVNKAYLLAYEVSRKHGNNMVASEALYDLLSYYSQKQGDQNKEEAKKYYDLFWKECDTADAKNPFSLLVAVEGMRMNEDGGAGFEPAAKKLREIIVREGKRNALDPDVEKAVNSYTDMYLDTMQKLGKPLTQEEAKNHFYNFPGITRDDVELKTLLRTVLISVYQEMLAKTPVENADLRANLQGAINVFFKELNDEFKPEQLTVYTLLQLGSHLVRSAQPMSSVPYFDEIINRNTDGVAEARFNKAIAYGLSKEKEKIDQGINMMVKEMESEKANASSKVMENAQYYLTRFYLDKEDYEKVLEQSEQYLANKYFREHKIDVQFMQAEAFEKMGNIDSAITTYLNIYGSNKGRISNSAPAVQKAMELYWKRNRPKPNNGVEDLVKSSDRHLAWKLGAEYINSTEHLFSQMRIQDRNKWRSVQDLVKEYYETPGIQQEDKVITDRKEALKAARKRR